MASYRIEWKNSAYQELQKLPRPMIARVVAAVSELSNEPFPHGVKKLVGSEFSYRIRIGDYRVVYEFLKTGWSLKLYASVTARMHIDDAEPSYLPFTV